MDENGKKSFGTFIKESWINRVEECVVQAAKNGRFNKVDPRIQKRVHALTSKIEAGKNTLCRFKEILGKVVVASDDKALIDKYMAATNDAQEVAVGLLVLDAGSEHSQAAFKAAQEGEYAEFAEHTCKVLQATECEWVAAEKVKEMIEKATAASEKQTVSAEDIARLVEMLKGKR